MSNISEISNKNNTIRIHILVILLVVALLAGCDKIEEGNGDTHLQSQLKYIGGSVRRMNDRVVI